MQLSPAHGLNMELDLQSLFRLLCTLCTQLYRYSLAETATPPLPPHLGSYTRALLVSQDRPHLFVTPAPATYTMLFREARLGKN
jgi:hypothetical protein